MPNKFLYLGWQGSRLWQEIDSRYVPGKHSAELVRRWYSSIHEVISSDSGQAYDIISLGCGTGQDDVEILKQRIEIDKTDGPRFAMLAIDLSWDLLVDGMSRIESAVRSDNRLRQAVTHLTGIQLDIERLTRLRWLLDPKKARLFHLLGLTLGNNFEKPLLESIYHCMRSNDYLLLGLDFSADGERMKDEALRCYTEGDAADSINNFLRSPLQLGHSQEQLGALNAAHFRSRPTGSDRVTERVNIIHLPPLVSPAYSQIPGAVSLVRQYEFAGHGARVVCDFSNKYTVDGFKMWIRQLKEFDGIKFEVKGLFELENSPQQLVLLKKTQD